jgi:hypothetical protein
VKPSFTLLRAFRSLCLIDEDYTVDQNSSAIGCTWGTIAEEFLPLLNVGMLAKFST